VTDTAKRFSRTCARAASAVLSLAIVLVPVVGASGSAQAQTFTVLYTFTSTADGEQPDASLIQDAAGNLYGTTQYGGTKGGFGTVFKLDTTGKESVLLSFAGTPDAEDPYSGLTRDKAGNLYGTTQYGGTGGGYGTVFKPDANGKLTLLHSFAGTPDGVNPLAGLLRDAAGNLYGTTFYGGTNGGYGTVFKLNAKGKLTLLHSFAGMPDGVNPYSRLIRDSAGNFYGTTFYGGTLGYGTVFKLDTAGKLTVLHSFNPSPDGAHPIAGLILDKAGNLYGATSDGGDLSCGFSGCGTVFKLTP
jgi:uncharacterized repeat protein (TIGR03803 family)